MLGQINAATVNGVLLNGSGQENFRYASAVITQADATVQSVAAASVAALLDVIQAAHALTGEAQALTAGDGLMTAGPDVLTGEAAVASGADLDAAQADQWLASAGAVSVASMAEYTEGNDVLVAFFRPTFRRKTTGADVTPHAGGSGLTRHTAGSSLTVH